ncbi:hypothetical protein KPA97_06235, partial [Burkholderia cenocepacia]|nr:hypothetical protein [Burkholderia cenocepacia]
MRHARQPVEADVVLLRAAAERLGRAAAQLGHLVEFVRELVDRTLRGGLEHLDARRALAARVVAM